MGVPVCPVAGTRGNRVTDTTLRALLKPDVHASLPPARYRFCATPGCSVVYYAEDGSHVVTLEDLVVRVGIKETTAPRPICYCYGYTVEEMIEEIRLTGSTTVPDRIRRRLEFEGCHCETTNPQGSCCLGTVLALAAQLHAAAGPPKAHEDGKPGPL